MPLNTVRLNYQRSSHPNERIVFIKPIQRPPAQKDDFDRAELVLKAIAAQCLPIMKNHYLSVTTLEEYEPNPEFIGRNFNNGEIIQLVIKSRSGAWLPLNMIQMVMMHELAHNTHMNHGKGFWQTRNLYAEEMRSLWSKGYSGEGLWGQGRSLRSVDEALGENVLRSEELGHLPLCGGTFRSRRKKRKLNSSSLTWKEKRDKRIEKKFGKNGEKLGEDEDARLMLEVNRKGPVGGKSRVAQSKRGRELRAAAALARFETTKTEAKEPDTVVKDETNNDEDETESGSEYEAVDNDQDDATDHLGQKITDSQGRNMVRTCEEGNGDDVDMKREMQELANLDSIPLAAPAEDEYTDQAKKNQRSSALERAHRETDLSLGHSNKAAIEPQTASGTGKARQGKHALDEVLDASGDGKSVVPIESTFPAATNPRHRRSDTQCAVCSMDNDPMALVCVACAHVLDHRKDPRHWKCTSEICEDNAYINAGDCGICGICGGKKPTGIPSKTPQKDRDTSRSNHSAHIAYI